MPRKPNGRLRSVRGQKIAKVVEKESLRLRADMTYLRNNVIANDNGQRVNIASSDRNPIKHSNARRNDTPMVNENLDTLRRAMDNSNPPSTLASKGIEQPATLGLKNRRLSSSNNIRDAKSCNGISLGEEGLGSKGSKNDSTLALGHSELRIPLMTNNVGSLRSTEVQTMEGPVHKAKKVDGLGTSDKPYRSKGRPSSRQANQKNDTKKVIGKVVQCLDDPSSKMNKSRRRYIEIDEDESGDVNDKNPMGIETNKVYDLNVGGAEDHGNGVSQLDNLTCGMMKGQRGCIETNQDVEPDDVNQNLVHAQDDNEEGMRTGTLVETDRGDKSLMGVDANKVDDMKSKGRKESMQEETYVTQGDDASEIVLQSKKLTHGPKKKRRRYIVASGDDEVEVDGGDHNRVDVEDKARAGSQAEAFITMDCPTEGRRPFVSEIVEQQCYCCSKPIDEPVWRGTLKIDGTEYTSLDGHLSTKSGEKVWKLSRSLQTSIEVMKLCGLKVRSKIWDSSKPSDDNIGLYFFPRGLCHDANMDQLINEVMENDLVLQAIIGEVEMLIFPSSLLPERYKTFQRKHYLWGLFKPRERQIAVAAEPLNGIVWRAQEEDRGKEHVSKQHNDVDAVESYQESILMERPMPLVNQGSEYNTRVGMDNSVYYKSPAEGTRQVSASCVPGATNIGFQLKAPEESKNEDASHHTVHTAETTVSATNSADVNTEAAVTTTIGINAANRPANHGQINSSMGVPPNRIICFVAARTPRLEQIIQELQREGSLVFAMQAEAWGRQHHNHNAAVKHGISGSMEVYEVGTAKIPSQHGDQVKVIPELFLRKQ